MKNPKFWVAVLVGGVVANIIDMIVMGMLLDPTFKSIPGMRQDANPLWFVIGDFFAVFVFTLLYDRVYSSFSGGPKGGATWGAYAGLIVSFPTWIFMHLMIDGFPYGLAWGLTISGIIWGVIVGATVGAMYKK
jgi:hypothetical protein